MGKEPFPFDLLYWNDDSTNMPAAMQSFYLRNMYGANALAQKGGITIDDVKIDLSTIKTPAYFLSTREDHIAPWQATYQGTQLLGGECTFTCWRPAVISPVSSTRPLRANIAIGHRIKRRPKARVSGLAAQKSMRDPYGHTGMRG